MLRQDLPRRVLALALVAAVAGVTVPLTRHADRPAPAASVAAPASAETPAPVPASAPTPAPDRQQNDAAGAGAARDIRALGPVITVTAPRCRVVGAVEQRALVRRLARGCGAAARRVDAAWPGAWPRRTLLVVPRDEDQVARVLGRDPATARVGLARTAAVTSGPAGAAATQVVINPQAWAQLRPVGERVVLTHELVHVAVRATVPGPVPDWLAEGFADLVGYAGTGLPARVVAGPALALVRSGDVPRTLPEDADFAADGTDPAAAYGFAWVAADTLARATGGAGLCRVYRAMASGESADAALRAENLGDTADLVRRWDARLKALAG